MDARVVTSGVRKMPAALEKDAFRFLIRVKRACLAGLFLGVCGCAPLLAGTGLETASTLLSLGGTGLTVIQMTSTGPGKMPVGMIPQQYANNKERMVREAWEQNYQLTRTVEWTDEELPWPDLVTAASRKAGEGKTLFALVEKRLSHSEKRTAAVTVYKTASGRILQDPAESPGEGFNPQTQIRQSTVPMFRYTAWYFGRSRQPSGILAGEGPWDGPCRKTHDYGALIRAVGGNTPAHAAQLQPGDIVTAVNGRRVEGDTLLFLLTHGINTLTVCRNGHTETRHLTLPTPRTIR